jgi:hypothetical protein
LRKLGHIDSCIHFHKTFREVERERARTRVREKKLGRKKRRVEIQEGGAKVKPKLSLCSIEVRGIVFIHNLLV